MLSCRAEWKGWVREWMTGRKETGYWSFQQTVAAIGSTAWWSLMWVQCQCHCKQSVCVIANRVPVCLQTECLCHCEHSASVFANRVSVSLRTVSMSLQTVSASVSLQCQHRCHCRQCQHCNQCHCKQCQHQCHCNQSVSVAPLLTPLC